jgi:multiple sugar transport system substrate-binding protein
MDNLRETAMLLTLDSAGRNATDPRFDPDKIVQWGLMLSDSPRSQGTFFGAGSLQAADGSAQIPKAWMSAWTWYHQLMWADHAAPNTAQQNTVLLGPGGGFSSGNIAMGFGFTWFLSLLLDTNGESMTFFDFAVTPEYNGTVTSQVNADVFSVLKTSAHPKEAQEVLGYLLGEAAADLVQVYGPVPARDDIRSAAIERFAATHVSAKNWSVFSDSIAFPDAPSAEEHLANSDAAEERLAAFGALLAGRANVDINLEAAKLQRDLNTIFAKGTSPANTASASTAP